MVTSSKKSGAREKGRNDSKWHFESFSFLKPKFAFESDEAGAGERVEGVSSPVKCNLLSSYLKQAPTR